MKLHELLAIVPDNYRIGLMDSDPDNYSMLVFGTKNEAIVGYARKARLDPTQVANLEVEAIHPGATTWLPAGVSMYGDDSAELHVKTQLLIEVSTEEEDEE